MNSPIKYFGGKGTMFKNIIQHFPQKTSFDTYIEPFGGSYSIGLKANPAPIEIYNDLEQNVYSLYKVLSDKEMFLEFKAKCDLALYSEDIRTEYKSLLKKELTILERAFYFFYVNRTSHNGIGGFSLNTVVRRGFSKSISDFLSCVDRLPELHNRLSKVVILNKDAIDLIDKYSNRESVFMYCDPPYDHSTRTAVRYKVDLNRDGHLKFIDSCLKAKCKILISGYDCEIYDALVNNGFNKIKFDVNTVDGNGKPKLKTETLWKNY